MKRRPSGAVGTGLSPRKRRRRVVESVLFVIGCLLLMDSVIGERGVVATRRNREQYERQERALAAARAENDRLTEQLQRLTDDPQTIEDEARRALGLMKPGEKVFRIKDVTPSASSR